MDQIERNPTMTFWPWSRESVVWNKKTIKDDEIELISINYVFEKIKDENWYPQFEFIGIKIFKSRKKLIKEKLRVDEVMTKASSQRKEKKVEYQTK